MIFNHDDQSINSLRFTFPLTIQQIVQSLLRLLLRLYYCTYVQMFDKCQSNQPSWGERMECGSVWLDAKRTDIDLNRFIQNNSFSFSFKTNVEDVIVDSSLNKSINSKINIIFLQEEKMAFFQFSYGVANKKYRF